MKLLPLYEINPVLRTVAHEQSLVERTQENPVYLVSALEFQLIGFIETFQRTLSLSHAVPEGNGCHDRHNQGRTIC